MSRPAVACACIAGATAQIHCSWLEPCDHVGTADDWTYTPSFSGTGYIHLYNNYSPECIRIRLLLSAVYHGFRKEQEYYLCAGYLKSRDICGSTHSLRTVILEELIL